MIPPISNRFTLAKENREVRQVPFQGGAFCHDFLGGPVRV